MEERNYETGCIVNPDIGAEAVKEFIKKATAFIEKQKGKDVAINEWGRRKLAYPIAKKKEGYYIFFSYSAPGDLISEFELMLKYNEGVLRYQTVKLEKKSAAAKKTDESKKEGSQQAGR